MQKIKDYIYYTSVLLAIQVVSILILKPEVNVSIQEMSRNWIFLLIITLPIFMMIEEVLFRYIPYAMISRIHNKKYFLIVVYIVFFLVNGGAHIANIVGSFNFIEAGKYFLIQGVCGMIFGYVYLKNGIFGSYYVHMLYDFVLLVILYMVVPV